MAILTNLDMDVLRTFVAGVDLGSFAKAAGRLGRSPSAISLQLRKLEEQTGCALFRKEGRGLVLTENGEMLVGYARRLLDLNDQALAAVRNPGVAGSVRLGLPQDFAETWLPKVLARFARLHPNVRVEACVDRTAVLIEAIDKGGLDLALVWDDSKRVPRGTFIAKLPMSWIGPRSGFVRDPAEPLPLIAFAPPCIFREAGIAALDAAGIAWRLTFTSPGLSGLWAAVAAGLGVTPRTPHGIPATLKAMDPASSGLPALPSLNLLLCRSGAPSPPVDRLASILSEAFAESLHASPVK